MANLNQFIDPDLTASDVTLALPMARLLAVADSVVLAWKHGDKKLGQPRVVGAYAPV